MTISCVLCVFFWQKHEKNSIFYHFCTHPCKIISMSPDVTIIARCDKCANTGCVARDCLCIYAYVRMALAIKPTSHAEVIIRSHCYVIMTAQFFAPELVKIYVDWIALLRRLLMTVNSSSYAYVSSTIGTFGDTNKEVNAIRMAWLWRPLVRLVQSALLNTSYWRHTYTAFTFMSQRSIISWLYTFPRRKRNIDYYRECGGGG